MRRHSRLVFVAVAVALTAGAANAGASLIQSEIEISAIGPVSLPLPLVGGVPFLLSGDVIRGTVSRMPYQMGVVQLVTHAIDGTWRATAAATEVARAPGASVTPWTIGSADLGCDAREARNIEVFAVFARHRLPVGAPESVNWGSLIRSRLLSVSCASFDRSELEVLEVGHTPVVARTPPRVSHFEDVKVRLAHVPHGAIAQLCVQPVDNASVWCQKNAYPTNGAEWLGTAYIGRSTTRRTPRGLEFTDQYERFWIKALIVRQPLPSRPSGISRDEWLALTPLVVTESAPVEVVRAYRPGQVRLVITTLGYSTNGRVRLAERISRVEGQYRPLPGYRHTGREVVTLLVRGRDDKTWRIAGKSAIPGDLITWVVVAADLNPGETPPHDNRIAIAVLTHKAFAPNVPVTEQILNSLAKSISDEVTFTLFDRGR